MTYTEILSTITPFLPSITIALVGITLLLLLWNSILEFRLRRLTRGSNGTSLEVHIASIAKEYEEFSKFKELILSRVANVDARLQDSVRGIGLVRFTPFKDSGLSKASFAVAFVSEKGDGVVVSTLHARENLSIFTKDVESFVSEQELTEEEAVALEKAKKSLHTAL